MHSEYIGMSGVRHFLISTSSASSEEEAVSVWPLSFSASVLTADNSHSDHNDELRNIYEQVALAAAARVRLITVALTLGSFLKAGRLSTVDLAMLLRITQLAPSAFIILRVSLAGGARLGMESNTLMSATNGSTMLCGCSWATKGGGPNGTDDCASPTQSWANAAGLQLQRLLSAADAAIPGRVAGVQLVGLSTGEWEMPHDDFVYTNGTASCLYRTLDLSASSTPGSAAEPGDRDSHAQALSTTSRATPKGWPPSGARHAASQVAARCQRRRIGVLRTPATPS